MDWRKLGVWIFQAALTGGTIYTAMNPKYAWLAPYLTALAGASNSPVNLPVPVIGNRKDG